MDMLLKPLHRLLSFPFRPPVFTHQKIERILLVRLDHLGDLLMATPAIAALRKKFPQARIDLLAGKRAERLFLGNSDIDQIHVFEAPWYDPRRGGEVWPVDVVRTIIQLRKREYDAAVDMRGDFRVIFLFLWLAGARKRIGFRDLGLGFLLTDPVEYDHERSFLDLNFDSLVPLGIETSDRKLKFFLETDDRAFVASELSANGVKRDSLLVGIGPTTNRVEQRWDEKRFAEVADRLIDDFGAQIVLVAAGDDAGIVGLMKGQMKHECLDLSGKTTIGQLGALMERMHLYIANDSGTMHLAIALGTPTVGIFGPSSIRRSWPYGQASKRYRAITAAVDCPRPCFRRDCEERECYDLISAEEVYRATAEILKGRAQG